MKSALPDSAQALSLPPLALYVHMPWCVQKCPYCDFNSHRAPLADAGPVSALAAETGEKYITALVNDLEAALPLVQGRSLLSVFIGGGTPSLFSGTAIARLLAAIRACLPLAPDAEVTLEANPGAVEAERFAAYRDAGVNRLSIGIQSFNPEHLRAIGRIHDAEEARRAVEIAARHFDTFNLDLMYGLPRQGFGEAMADLETALAFAPSHLSCYQLTVEPNTAFHAAPPPLPEDDLCADIGEAIAARLESAGFDHYETSAFARPGRRCRHNLNYWEFGDYLGIGAGAHSKLTQPEGGTGILRQMRWKQPERYLREALRKDRRRAPVQEEMWVDAAALPGEFMMNALRLCHGFPAALFHERTGLPFSAVAGILRQAQAEGLVCVDPPGEEEGGSIVPTRRGGLFLNALLRRFLPE
ncbi:MAG: radical SAM family heme chaperone HemW [Betaproteobacteria bacterium]|nr:radical SAM family heme chaperone HemW [Betaproteobacteria bacterium]